MRYRKNFHVSLDPEYIEWFKNTAHDANISVSKLIELLADRYRKPKAANTLDYEAMMSVGMKNHCSLRMRNGAYALQVLRKRNGKV